MSIVHLMEEAMPEFVPFEFDTEPSRWKPFHCNVCNEDVGVDNSGNCLTCGNNVMSLPDHRHLIGG